MKVSHPVKEGEKIYFHLETNCSQLHNKNEEQNNFTLVLLKNYDFITN